MLYFKNGEFEIKNTKEIDLVLLKISNSLFNLSKSDVFLNRLAIGGVYHKNYYNLICAGFYNNKNAVFCAKNMLLSEFLYNLKHNLCNYGIYFFKKNNKLFLKIYSGNTFLLDENQTNYVEKNINKEIFFKNESIKFKKLEDFYEKEFLNKLNVFNFKIICENEHLSKQIKRCNLSNKSSEFKVYIFKTMEYKIYFNKKELSLNKIFKNFKRYDIIESELINKINLGKIKKVINKQFLIYNKSTNTFDIFYTLKYLSWRISNDKNYTKLV